VPGTPVPALEPAKPDALEPAKPDHDDPPYSGPPYGSPWCPGPVLVHL